MAPEDFRSEQRAVAAGMAAALVISLATVGLCLWRAAAPPVPFDDRMTLALSAALFPLFWLFAGIANIARLRFFSAQDIAGAGLTEPSEAIRAARAILQNTLEQAVLAAPLYLALAALLADPAPLVPALATLFSVGRFLFWAGYRRGAAARALGFGLTFYPTGLALFAAIAIVTARSLG